MAEAYFEVYDDFQPDPPPATAAPTGTPSPGVTPAPTPEPFDFTQAMRALRVRVEAMLADGRVDEAEALMNAKRDEFEEAGYFIRRLNQAYFAFHGFYGDSPASIDPIGPKVQTLLDEAGSPGEFIRRVRSITSRVDLDDALAHGLGARGSGLTDVVVELNNTHCVVPLEVRAEASDRLVVEQALPPVVSLEAG
jgi:hypothetical protein